MVGSAPEVFRNFGAGALLLLLPFGKDDPSQVFGLLQFMEASISAFPSMQVALTAMLVLACYFVGVLCNMMGETVFAVLPGRYTEREIEMESSILRSGLEPALTRLSDHRQKLDGLHIAVGFGVLGFVETVGLATDGWEGPVFTYVIAFGLIALLAALRRFWLADRFRALMDLVVGVPKKVKG